MRVAAAVAVVSLATLGAAGGTPDLDTLYRAHRWLELRAALTRSGPALYRGAVAAAFHDDAGAERILRALIRAEPRSQQAYEAHRLLGRMYLRNGQYRRLWTDLEDRLSAFPGRAELAAERNELAAFRGLPDQRLVSSRAAVLRHDRSVFVPVSVAGRAAKYFVDTGAWLSCMSESEARRLGLTILDGGGTLGTSAGARAGFRAAVAHRVVVGEHHFEDVSFAVFRDDQEPWSQLPPGERGILGVPVLLGLEALRWSALGTLAIGPGPGAAKASAPNLLFDDDHLVVAATAADRPLLATLDTGAETTDLYVRFARDFDGLVRDGKRSTTEVRGVGKAESFESLTVPELSFVLGQAPVTLRPGRVILREMGAACCVGNVGLDLLTQTGAFSIDFTSMRIELSGAAVPHR
jgi:hypothetical protein